MPAHTNIQGPKHQLYAEQKPSPDPTSFREDNTSEQYYNSAYFLAHKSQVQRIPPRRDERPLNLGDFLPAEMTTAIQNAGKITFHAVGDTGAAKVNRTQTASTALGHETAVVDAMVKETQAQDGPAFFYHLGDVIYNFGEAQYYYDQFYEPFRDYDRPIFAIPGNHDGMVFGSGSSAPQVPTLEAFLTNFCAAAPGPSPDGGGMVRSVMTQPGVYFRLDAPFLTILGIYSNVLDGPGVISSQGGHFPIADDQLTFLKTELANLKAARAAGKKMAVILAVHHPPLSADARHSGSDGILTDIDKCCNDAGLTPDMLLSGHAHLYQRFTRRINGREVPYIVAGCGGFAATAPKTAPGAAPVTVGDHTLEIDPIVDFGYLTIETDAKTLTCTFKTADGGGVTERDRVTVDLMAGTITQGTAVAGGRAKPAHGSAGPRGPAGGRGKKPVKPKRKAAGA